MALRRDGATVNDVLLGALAVAVHRWNEMHGEPVGGRVALTMPINLRPPEWRFEVLGNFASYVSVPVALEHPDDLGAAVAAAAQRTRAIKDRDAAGLMVDLLQVPTATLPTGVKRRFQDLIPLTGDRWVDTAVLSNLGRLEPLEPLDEDAGSVRRLWFSPPGRMPLGASFGAATYGDELLLTLRYRHALLDADAAERFIRSLHEILIEPDNGATP
jgi:NRPS condensation-like uncharacterized protein